MSAPRVFVAGFDLNVSAEDEGIFRAATDIASSGVSVEAVDADLATYAGVETFYAAIGRLVSPLRGPWHPDD